MRFVFILSPGDAGRVTLCQSAKRNQLPSEAETCALSMARARYRRLNTGSTPRTADRSPRASRWCSEPLRGLRWPPTRRSPTPREGRVAARCSSRRLERADASAEAWCADIADPRVAEPDASAEASVDPAAVGSEVFCATARRSHRTSRGCPPPTVPGSMSRSVTLTSRGGRRRRSAGIWRG